MFLDIANAIVKVIDKVGLLQAAIMGVAGALSLRDNNFGRFFQKVENKNPTGIANAFFGGIQLNRKGAGKIFDLTGIKTYASEIQKVMSLEKGFDKIRALGIGISNASSAAKLKEKAATEAMGIASKAGAVAVGVLNMAMSMLITWAITAAISGLVKLASAQKDAADAAKEHAQASKEAYDEAKSDQKSVDDLIAKYKELRSQKLQTAEVRGEISSVQKEIVSLVGEQASGLNLVNGNLDTELRKLNAIAAKQAEVTKAKAQESYSDASLAESKAMGEGSYFFTKGWAYAGNKDKDAAKILQEKGYNVTGGGLLHDKTLVKDTYDNDGNKLTGALEKAKYLRSMLDELELNYDDYQTSEVYGGLLDQYNTYMALVEERRQAAKSLLESTTSDFYYNNKDLNKEAVYSIDTLQAYRNKLVNELSDNSQIKTALKNGDINIADIYSYVDDFIASTEDFTAYYGGWKNKFQNTLTNDQKDFTKTLMAGGKENGKYIKSWFDSLSDEDQKLVYDIALEFDDEAAEWNLQNWKDQLSSMQETIEFSVDINLESETKSIEGLNTALQESTSAAGLSEASIKNLQGRYSELTTQGYNLSELFEETANGIHLNRNALAELEQAYAKQKQEEFSSSLEGLRGKYDELTENIKNCNDETEKANLIAERANLAQRISEVATLASKYDGLTSAYKSWQDAESAGSERDMYENVLKGFDTLDDEIKRGWIDDGSIEFLELLSGRTDLATASTKKLKKVYEGLDKEINSAGYSVRDFFTVDSEGNSTNTGVYNFLETVEALEKDKSFEKIKNIQDLVKRDKNGNIVSFDFGVVGGDEAIAEALGISEELVQIMVRAADDAGFVVNIDGSYKQLADLENEAVAANDKLQELSKTNDELRKAGGDTNFKFNTSDVSSLKDQLKTAKGILDQFKDKDGNINLKADGAEEAMTIVSTLQAKLDALTAEKYGIGLTVDDKQFQEPLEKLQEYGHNIMTLNQLKINPKANTKEIKKINKQLNETAEYFANLDEDTKVQIGFEADDGIQEVKKKIENGEVKIPTTLDIQAKMSKSIEDLKKIALLNSGLLTGEQEKTIKAELIADIEVEAGEVNTDKLEKDTEKKTKEALKKKKKVKTPIPNPIPNPIPQPELGIKSNKQPNKTSDPNYKSKLVELPFIQAQRKQIEKLRKEQMELATKGATSINQKDLEAAKNKLLEIQKAQRDLYSGQLGKVEGLKNGKMNAIVDIAVDYENGKKSFEDLKSQIQSIEDEEVRVNVIAQLAKSGAFDQLLSDLNDTDKQIVIDAIVNGEADVDQLNTIIGNLPETVQPQVMALVDDALTNVKIVDGKLVEIDGKTAKTKIEGDASGAQSAAIQAITAVEDVPKSKTSHLKGDPSGAVSAAGTANQAVTGVTSFWMSTFSGNPLMAIRAAGQARGAVNTVPLNPSVIFGGTVAQSLYTAASNAIAKIREVRRASGSGGLNGNAHVKGTAFAGGTAYKGGTWGAPRSEMALVGELGPEIISRNNKWFTVGDQGAEFFPVQRGDIIFNHRQTKDILNKGYVSGRSARVNGTAFKDGTIDDDQQKMIVRGNHWFTADDDSNIHRGDIVFNPKQSEELLNKGRIKGRGTAHVKGTAWAEGTAYNSKGSSGSGGWGKANGQTSSGSKKKKYKKPSKNKSTNKKNTTKWEKATKNKAPKSSGNFKEVFDWIEVKVEEINENLDLMAAKLKNAIDLTNEAKTGKNDLIEAMISTSLDEINTLEKGYKKYNNRANNILKSKNKKGKYIIPKKYWNAVKDGKISIETFKGKTDEKTLNKIKEYREWAQKAADLKKQIQEVKSEIADLAKQKFDNIEEAYNNMMEVYNRHPINRIQNYIDLTEEKGNIASAKSYEEMIRQEQEAQDKLITSRNKMQQSLDESVKKGRIEKESPQWWDAVKAIQAMNEEIDAAELNIEKYNNAINDIKWKVFDTTISRIDALSNETQNLIDLMGDVEDAVKTPERESGWGANEVEWTKEGLTSLGLYAQQMEIAQEKAKQYQKAIEELDADYAAGKYSENEYYEKLAELKDGQYDAIKSYHDAKDAIVELNEARIDAIKEGIEREIQSYQELIDKKKEELSAEKD